MVAEAKLALDGDALLKEGNDRSQLLSSFMEALSADGSQGTLDAIKDLKARARECGANLVILQKDLVKVDLEGAKEVAEKLKAELNKMASFIEEHGDLTTAACGQFEVVMAALWANAAEGQLQVQYDLVTMGFDAGSDLWFGRLSLLCPIHRIAV